MISPSVYLASIVAARPLYKLLYEDAASMIPPFDPDKPVTTVRLTSQLPMTELGRKLNVSPAVVGVDLQRLVNFGWISHRIAPRGLGSREGAKLYLMADVVALAATGVPNLVTREVLGLRVKVDPIAPTPTSSPQDSRGAKRRWKAD
jgi:hypothetical protein